MPNRLHAILIFAGFGALAAIGVFAIMGTGEMPSESKTMIALAALAAALTTWPFAHRLNERGTFFSMLTGAVILLLAQVPFAALTIAAFSLQEPIPAGEIFQTFALIVAAGWGIAGPFQVICGAAAGWLVRRISPERPPLEDDDPDEPSPSGN